MRRFVLPGLVGWEGVYGGRRSEAALATAVGETDVMFIITKQGEVADPYVVRLSAPWLNEKVLVAACGLTK